MSETLAKYCDNTSVGVILKNSGDEIALSKSTHSPACLAPPAGHVNGRGTPEEAATAEVYEALGLHIALGGLRRTAIYNRRVQNQCQRIGGDHHYWSVFEAESEEALPSDALKARGADWFNLTDVQGLAGLSRAYQQGRMSEEVLRERYSGDLLEPVWIDFLEELDWIRL